MKPKPSASTPEEVTELRARPPASSKGPRTPFSDLDELDEAGSRHIAMHSGRHPGTRRIGHSRL
ncbi:MAG: hypothetical protein QOJ20_5402 [Mycobacterium sp.]|jgi:hypothetical protein|nr:hypothetical protein [Mycobacterium sp.]